MSTINEKNITDYEGFNEPITKDHKEDSYTAKNIIVSKFPECVQQSPGMYIGDTNEGGKEHMIDEIVFNAADEYLAGFAKVITIVLRKDDFIEVEDDGRGMPPDVIEYEDDFGNKIQRSGIETIFTVLHAGAKSTGANNGYKVSGGLHGVGASVVNALSEELEVRVYKNHEYTMKFMNGITVEPLKKLGATKKRGTFVRFKPSTKIFTQPSINETLILKKVEELAFLNSGITINFTSEKNQIHHMFHFPNGLLDFIIKILNKKKTVVEPIFFSSREETFECEVAMAWCAEYEDEECFAFTNNIPQPDLGYHVTGFRFGVMRSINDYISKNKTRDYIKAFFTKHKDIEITSEDVRGAMKYIISVKCQKPMFSSQTKTKLVSPFVRTKVEKLVDEELRNYLEKNPEIAKKIISKIFVNALARNIAKKERAKDFEMNDVDSFSIPGKLTDCDKRIPPKDRELMIVEGDSAAGTAKEAKSPHQAILCMKGKPNNAIKMDKLKVLGTEGLMMIVSVLGINFNDFEEDSGVNYLEKLRYHKIIIMADADVDGSHIRALMLAFFYKYLPTLIENGHVYIALPPLYGVKLNQQITYIRDEETFKTFLAGKFYDDYEFESLDYKLGEKKILNREDINNLILLCNDYKVRIEQIWKGDLPLEILSLFMFLLVQKLSFEDIQKKIQENYSNYNLLDHTDYYILQEKTVYGINNYHVNKILPDINSVLLKIFPLKITPKKTFTKVGPQIFENPLYLLTYINNIIKKIDIQRFKGLGEMNADQLKETSVDPTTRQIIQISLDHKDAYTREVVYDLMTLEGVGVRKDMILNALDKNLLLDI